MADIDLTIKYTDTNIEDLKKDLNTVRDKAMAVQKTLDGINLQGLEKKFKSLGKVAMAAFGRGLQTRISTVTKRIGGQRAAVKALINQYALLAAVQKGVMPGPVAPPKKTSPAQYATTTGRGAQLAATPMSKFEQFEKDFGGISETTIGKSAASTRDYYEKKIKDERAQLDRKGLSVTERRASLAKDLIRSDMTTAQLAERYGKSMATIYRDKKAITQESMKALTAERKLLASSAHPSQISTRQPKLPPTKMELEDRARRRAPAQYATTAGTGRTLPGPQKSLADEIQAGQEAAMASRPDLTESKRIDKYKRMGQHYARGPAAGAGQYPSPIGPEPFIGPQPHRTGRQATARVQEMFNVPTSGSGIKSSSKDMAMYEKNIDTARKKLQDLNVAQNQLAQERTKAITRGAPAQRAAVEEEMLKNAVRRQDAEDVLRKNIDKQTLAKSQNASAEKTLTQNAEKTNQALDKRGDIKPVDQQAPIAEKQLTDQAKKTNEALEKRQTVTRATGTQNKAALEQQIAGDMKRLEGMKRMQEAQQKGFDSATTEGRTQDAEKYQKSMLDSTKKQKALTENINENIRKRNDLMRKGTRTAKQQADATKTAEKRGDVSTAAQAKADKEATLRRVAAKRKELEAQGKLTESIKEASKTQLLGTDNRGAKATQTADTIQKAAEKENKARKSQAQTFTDMSKRVEHAQGRVDAAIIKAQRNISLIPKTSRAFQPQADALGELRSLGTALRGKDQAGALKTYQKDADRLFDTVSKGAQQAKKHMGFMNSGFAKFSIIMSGMAATMFVWQQLSTAIKAIVRNFTEFEDTFAKIQDSLKLSTNEMTEFREESREAGKTGAITTKQYAEMVTQLRKAGMSGEDAMARVNRIVERQQKIMQDTLGGEMKEFKGLASDIGVSMGEATSPELMQWMENLNKEIRDIANAEKGLSTYAQTLDVVNEVVSTAGSYVAPSPRNLIQTIKAMRVAAKEYKELKKEMVEPIEPSVGGTDVALENFLNTMSKVEPEFAAVGTDAALQDFLDDLVPDTFDPLEVKQPLKINYEYDATLEEGLQMMKNLDKDQLKAGQILGRYVGSTYEKEETKIKMLLGNLVNVKGISDDALAEIKSVLMGDLKRKELQLSLVDHKKYYSTLSKYSEEYTKSELDRLKKEHRQRLIRGFDEGKSKEISQRDYLNLNKRKTRSFIAQERQYEELLGAPSGRQIEVGIGFDPKTGEEITEMMNYFQLLEFNILKSVEKMNAGISTIGTTGTQAFKKFSSEGGEDITKMIEAAAEKYKLDPIMIESIMKNESGFDPNAIGSKIDGTTDRAHGLMQLIPDTSRKLGLDPSERFDPEKNIDAGAKLLRQLVDQFGNDMELVVTAYHAGPNRVAKALINPEAYPKTTTHKEKVVSHYNKLKSEQGAVDPTETLTNQQLAQEKLFKEGQRRNKQRFDAHKELYDQLGMYTEAYYENQLLLIGKSERDSTRFIDANDAEKIANKKRFFERMKYERAAEAPIAPDRLKELEKSFSETDVMSPQLIKQRQIDIKQRRKYTDEFSTSPEEKQSGIIEEAQSNLTLYEDMNKLRVNSDKEYFSQSKIMTQFLYDYKKQKIFEEAKILDAAQVDQLKIAEITQNKLQALEDESGKNRVDAWRTIQAETGKYSDAHLSYEKKNLKRIREEHIKATNDVQGAWEWFKRKELKLDIQVNLKSEDAMAGLQALRDQMALETETMAEAVNKNLRKIVEGTKDNFGTLFYDTMQGNFESVWDLFESTGDRFKQMIDRMVSDYLASQMSKALFGDIGGGAAGGGGGLLKGLIDTFLGGFGGSSLKPIHVGAGGTTAFGLASGGIIDKPTRFIKMASGGMIEGPMTSGAIEIGEAGPEAVMPLKRSKSGKLGIETSDGVTAPLKRLASGNLGIDSSVIDGGYLKKMAKGGIISRNMISVEQDMIDKNQSFKPPNTTGLATGGIINKRTVFRDGDYLGKTIHMASGGLIEQTMSTPFASGNSVEIGENGPEVVMPIARTKGGKMGVQIEGGTGQKIENHFHVKVEAPNGKIDSQSMNQMQTKLGMAVNRSLRRNA